MNNKIIITTIVVLAIGGGVGFYLKKQSDKKKKEALAKTNAEKPKTDAQKLAEQIMKADMERQKAIDKTVDIANMGMGLLTNPMV